MSLLSQEAAERTVRVLVESAGGYEFRVKFPGPWPELATDEPEPLGKGAGPNPAMQLAGAVANCLSASLLFCLRKSRVDARDASADCTLTLARNDRGRWRVSKADVNLAVHVPEGAGDRAARCESLFQDFCIVTESVRSGFPVDVRVRTIETAVAPRAGVTAPDPEGTTVG